MISLQRRAPDWPVKEKAKKNMFQLRDWFVSSRRRCWVYHFWDWYGLIKDLLLSESIPWKKACCCSSFGADDRLPEGTFYWIFIIHDSILSTEMGVSLNWWYPQNTPKWSFLVGKPMVVGETHHFRKPPNGNWIHFVNFYVLLVGYL